MNRPRTLVLSAIAVVVLLAGSFGVRLLAGGAGKPAPQLLPRFAQAAPPASVPAPKAIGALKVPCWGCPDANQWPVAFRTDLDLLAPLGTGSGNAALWLKDFNKEVGARYPDLEKAMERRVKVSEEFPTVFAGDDPLLREAEPWAEQATMRTYPEVYPVLGMETRLPNLLFAINLAKGWAARAASHPGTPVATEDARRVIRWGRLLRQDDVTIVQDLVGLACIRMGAEQLYDAAVGQGDQPLALAAAMVLGEHAPQRLRTAQVLTRLVLTAAEGFEHATTGRALMSGRVPTEAKVAAILETVKGTPERRFRLEAIAQLQLVRQLGSKAQAAQVEGVLDGLCQGPDPIVAAAAKHARQTTIDDETLATILMKDEFGNPRMIPMISVKGP
jgi:hypothetical protein